jgi:hypothetical protein
MTLARRSLASHFWECGEVERQGSWWSFLSSACFQAQRFLEFSNHGIRDYPNITREVLGSLCVADQEGQFKQEKWHSNWSSKVMIAEDQR